MKLIFDIETNGLLEEVDTLHCISLMDADTGTQWIATDFPGYEPEAGVTLLTVIEGLMMMDDATMLIGHNIIAYDLPVLRKLQVFTARKQIIRDTIVMARLVWPKDHLREKDFKLHKLEKIPGNMIGACSLQAFGYRLLEYKGDYSGEWHTCNKDMLDYAVQDAVVTKRLWDRLAKENWPEQSIELEHAVATIVFR